MHPLDAESWTWSDGIARYRAVGSMERQPVLHDLCGPQDWMGAPAITTSDSTPLSQRYLSFTGAAVSQSAADRAIQGVLSRIAPKRFRHDRGPLDLAGIYKIDPPRGGAHLFRLVRTRRFNCRPFACLSRTCLTVGTLYATCSPRSTVNFNCKSSQPALTSNGRCIPCRSGTAVNLFASCGQCGILTGGISFRRASRRISKSKASTRSGTSDSDWIKRRLPATCRGLAGISRKDRSGKATSRRLTLRPPNERSRRVQ
jgi:hypothetical protein